MIAILLASLVGTAVPNWVEQAFMGRPGSKWTAVVAMNRPGPGDDRDTGRACRDGTSERLDLHHGSHFMAGDSTVFLESVTHIAWVGPRRNFPTPPDSKFDIVRTEQFLGRTVVVADIQGPHGHGRRLWIDTTLPLVMKSEPLQKDPEGRGEPPERQFLALQVGVPCPASDFQIPQGWTINHGHPPRPLHPEGRPDRAHRRHEVESPQSLATAVGFEPPAPPWLPAGFTARSWAWIETRQGKAAQILFGDGTGTVSVFFRPATDEPAPYCPASGCKDREGRAVYFGKTGAFAIAATGELSSEQMERVVGNKK